MPIRLLCYIAEFYDSLPARPRGGKYPAVFPIVLYNGSATSLPGMRNLVSLLFYAESVPPEELALSLDSFFEILKKEDADAVHLFSR